MTPEDKAKRAEQILKDPVFEEVIQQVEHMLYSSWVTADDQEQRERIWAMNKGLSLVLGQLQAAAASLRVGAYNANLRDKHK